MPALRLAIGRANASGPRGDRRRAGFGCGGGRVGYAIPVTLANPEIVAPDGSGDGRYRAVFDLSDAQVAVVADALSYLRRTRFAGEALEADDVLALRTLSGLLDTVQEHAAAGGHAVLRIDADEACLLVRAAAAYVDERDTESFQSPEERERLAVLRALVEPLMDLAGALHRAEREATDRSG
jgi:hypothetical protein